MESRLNKVSLPKGRKGFPLTDVTNSKLFGPGGAARSLVEGGVALPTPPGVEQKRNCLTSQGEPDKPSA